MKRLNRVVVAGAWLALVVSPGCKAVHGLGDAGPGDDDDDGGTASIDAAAVEPGEVRVKVLDRFGVPEPGVVVVFQDPDGAPFAQLTTDGNGVVDQEVEADSYVTVYQPENSSEDGITYRINTLAGLIPGDIIEVGPRVPDVPSERIGRLDFTFSPWAAASYYEAQIGCDRFPPQASQLNSWDVWANQCNGGLEPIDVLLTARDDGGRPVAYALGLDMPIDTGTTTGFAPWQTNWRDVPVRVLNAPVDMVAAEVQLHIMHRGLDYGVSDGDTLDLGGGDAEIAMQFPPSFTGGLQAQAMGMYSQSGDVNAIDGVTMIVRSLSPAVADIEVDIDTDALPPVWDVVYSPDADGWIVSYATDADPSALTLTAVGLTWTEGDVRWDWTMVAPPDAGSPLRLPRIPDDAIRDPISDEISWPPDPAATLTQLAAGTASLPGSWDELRQNRPFDIFDNPLPLDAPMGTQAQLSFGGQLELH